MKIKGLRWMATFLAACMLMGAVPATAFAAKETTEAAETIPQVYRMDDDNDTVRLVIGKTPTLYIGKNGLFRYAQKGADAQKFIQDIVFGENGGQKYGNQGFQSLCVHLSQLLSCSRPHCGAKMAEPIPRTQSLKRKMRNDSFIFHSVPPAWNPCRRLPSPESWNRRLPRGSRSSRWIPGHGLLWRAFQPGRSACQTRRNRRAAAGK